MEARVKTDTSVGGAWVGLKLVLNIFMKEIGEKIFQGGWGSSGGTWTFHSVKTA